MAFLARQNKQNLTSQQPNRAYGRGSLIPKDQGQVEQKLSQQQLYKQQLQQQIFQKQERKKRQLEKIRKQDEKFMRQIQEINKKQRQRKDLEKQKQQKILEDSNQSPKLKKELPENKSARIPIGSLNVGIRDQQPILQQLPKLSFNTDYEQNQNILYSHQRKRPYLYQQNDQVNSYYEERIRRHKQQMNQKLDELFHHIHSTKDNIKAEQEIDKIKRKLRGKQAPIVGQYGGQSQVQLQFQNKFYHVPKANKQAYRLNNQQKSRVLDYQSSSKFKISKNQQQSRAKIRTQNDDFYSIPQVDSQSRLQKWGKPGKDNFLGNREAIDYQAQKTLGEIQEYLGYLKKQA